MPGPSRQARRSEPKFDWPLAYGAESLVRRFVGAFLRQNAFARRLSGRMRDETATDFCEWVDHFSVGPAQAPAFAAAGFVEEAVDRPAGTAALRHPRAMLPRVLVREGGSAGGVPRSLALRVESVADFLAAQKAAAPIEGPPGSGLRRATVAGPKGAVLEAVERLGYRGFVAGRAAFSGGDIDSARERWRLRGRGPGTDASLLRVARSLQDTVVEAVGMDIACDLFFAAERGYWQSRNLAARVQKGRQDALGLGWANHDHHTYRCSRRLFPETIGFFSRFGFEKRERYYAGAQAGWGAQIMEQPVAGIVVFADVDLMPDEVAVDFSTERLPEAGRLGTVGLWCALHGDSLLQAGMHHLEARFDFPRLRDQLSGEGIGTMAPFSDFPFLRQAFTEGERWPVDRVRAGRLLAKGLITRAQFDGFVRDGAIGSHLENLQRRGGFKGFNQKSVSAIISATDPRRIQAAASA